MGVKKVEKRTRPFLGDNHGAFGFFLIQKTFSSSRLHGVCMGRSGTTFDAVSALFSHFCNIGCFGDLGDLVIGGCKWACCNSLCVLAYNRMFFVACRLVEGWSTPVPKMQNDSFHQ